MESEESDWRIKRERKSKEKKRERDEENDREREKRQRWRSSQIILLVQCFFIFFIGGDAYPSPSE